jgi:uncharacterized protein YfbU (UPF0304 family)
MGMPCKERMITRTTGDKNVETYFINEAMLGPDATEADAHRMVELLYDRGYDVRYGDSAEQHDSVTENTMENVIDDKEWQQCLEIIRQEKNS